MHTTPASAVASFVARRGLRLPKADGDDDDDGLLRCCEGCAPFAALARWLKRPVVVMDPGATSTTGRCWLPGEEHERRVRCADGRITSVDNREPAVDVRMRGVSVFRTDGKDGEVSAYHLPGDHHHLRRRAHDAAVCCPGKQDVRRLAPAPCCGTTQGCPSARRGGVKRMVRGVVTETDAMLRDWLRGVLGDCVAVMECGGGRTVREDVVLDVLRRRGATLYR